MVYFNSTPRPFPFPFCGGGGRGEEPQKSNAKEMGVGCGDRGEQNTPERERRRVERAEGVPRRVPAQSERTIQFRATTCSRACVSPSHGFAARKRFAQRLECQHHKTLSAYCTGSPRMRGAPGACRASPSFGTIKNPDFSGFYRTALYKFTAQEYRDNIHILHYPHLQPDRIHIPIPVPIHIYLSMRILPHLPHPNTHLPIYK